MSNIFGWVFHDIEILKVSIVCSLFVKLCKFLQWSQWIFQIAIKTERYRLLLPYLFLIGFNLLLSVIFFITVIVAFAFIGVTYEMVRFQLTFITFKTPVQLLHRYNTFVLKNKIHLAVVFSLFSKLSSRLVTPPHLFGMKDLHESSTIIPLAAPMSAHSMI